MDKSNLKILLRQTLDEEVRLRGFLVKKFQNTKTKFVFGEILRDTVLIAKFEQLDDLIEEILGLLDEDSPDEKETPTT